MFHSARIWPLNCESASIGAFNKERAQVGAFSWHCETSQRSVNSSTPPATCTMTPCPRRQRPAGRGAGHLPQAAHLQAVGDGGGGGGAAGRAGGHAALPGPHSGSDHPRLPPAHSRPARLPGQHTLVSILTTVQTCRLIYSSTSHQIQTKYKQKHSNLCLCSARWMNESMT